MSLYNIVYEDLYNAATKIYNEQNDSYYNENMRNQISAIYYKLQEDVIFNSKDSGYFDDVIGDIYDINSQLDAYYAVQHDLAKVYDVKDSREFGTGLYDYYYGYIGLYIILYKYYANNILKDVVSEVVQANQ